MNQTAFPYYDTIQAKLIAHIFVNF